MKKNFAKFIEELEWVDSIIGLVAISIILVAALLVQYFEGETPCPLCLLQRAALINVGLSLLMNVRYGNKVVHWAMVIISSCSGIAVSIRQILLHINSAEGFGGTFLGLHMYTGCFIIFSICIVGSALMLLIYPERRQSS